MTTLINNTYTKEQKKNPPKLIDGFIANKRFVFSGVDPVGLEPTTS